MIALTVLTLNRQTVRRIANRRRRRRRRRRRHHHHHHHHHHHYLFAQNEETNVRTQISPRATLQGAPRVAAPCSVARGTAQV